jgi:hypothetical protein
MRRPDLEHNPGDELRVCCPDMIDTGVHDEYETQCPQVVQIIGARS